MYFKLPVLLVLSAGLAIIMPVFSSAGRLNVVVPEPTTFEIHTYTGDRPNLGPLQHALVHKFGYRHAQFEDAAPNLNDQEELRSKIADAPENRPFVVFGDLRSHRRLGLATPIAFDVSRREDVKHLALFSLRSETVGSARKRVEPIGYVEVKNAPGLVDTLTHSSTEDLGDFQAGKVLSKQSILDLLYLHDL